MGPLEFRGQIVLNFIPFASLPLSRASHFYEAYWLVLNGGTVWCLQDYYKILEVDYDASEETIRSSYIRLALVGIYPTTNEVL